LSRLALGHNVTVCVSRLAITPVWLDTSGLVADKVSKAGSSELTCLEFEKLTR
jgi:hypothetical protein